METSEQQQVQSTVVGQLGKIVYAQLAPGADLYTSIVDVCKAEQIETGLVLNITGALTKTRLSTPVKKDRVEAPPEFIELDGLAEATGTGYIGRTVDSWKSQVSQITLSAGDPFLHVHLVVSVGGETHCGHLIEGCLVRSLHPKSHFVVVIADTQGIDLSFHRDDDSGVETYPNGLPFYELAAQG
jgi:predicted DNA-binding protein with PD1-like motif